MDRDFMPALIVVIAMGAIAIVTWVLVGPPAASAQCYLQRRPATEVWAMHPDPPTLTPNDQHCLSR